MYVKHALYICLFVVFNITTFIYEYDQSLIRTHVWQHLKFIIKTSEMVFMAKVKDTILEIQEQEGIIEVEDNLSYVSIEVTGFQAICNRLAELETKTKDLELQNDFLQKELHDIKSMSMFEFGNIYCSSESLEADGHAFARNLLGKPMTDEDIAIEKAENGYKPYTAEDF